MTKTFAAQIQDFADLTKRNMRHVAVEAIQDVMEAAQTPQLGITKGATSFVEGKIPVAEADLINSLSVDGGEASSDAYVTALAGYELGDNMRFTWTAEYAMRMEVGFTGIDELGREYNQPGRHYVGANAARFEEFVLLRAAEVST